MSVSPSSATGASVTTSTSSSSVDRSGLTEDDVLQAKIAPYLDQIDVFTAETAINETQISAYQEMQTLLQNLENAVEELSNPGDGTTNIFDALLASLTSSNSVSASSILSTSIAPGTAPGNHTVSVSQLAESETLAGSSQTSQSAALDLSGSFTVGESGSTAATITMTSGMSLSQLVSSINAQSTTTGVTASVISVSNSASDPEYRLVLSGSDTDQTINLSDGGTVLSSLGITGADGSTAADVLQAAQPAILTVDGISGIERPTNDISDILSGVTLNLTQANPSTTITMSISNDTSSVETAIDSFVTAYNAWRTFVNANQETDTSTDTSTGTTVGGAASTATLFGNSTLRDASLSIDDALNAYVGSSSLSSIGLSLDGSNHLTVDTATLAAALSNSFSTVAQLFQYQATTSSGDLALIAHSGATYSGTFTLDLATDANGNLTGVSGTDSSGNAVDFTFSGDTISGASGTPYAGMTFFFGGNSSESITVNASQGIADQLFQSADSFDATGTGTIENMITSLQAEDSMNAERSSELQTEANDYAETLLLQYSNLEASISEANQTQSILQEMMSSDNSSN
jgi:flagellar hook-associated protein 2